MCGICGVWGETTLSQIETMVAAMEHRGPDDSGIYRDEAVTIGMSRLAIQDLSPAGHQPMGNPEQTVWIVYNGEVYNFQSERKLLEAQGQTFRSRSDTEVILHLYARYGDDFLLRLRGMFALAIYDKRRGRGHERLLIARDPIGIKPLLYARVGQRLIFGSEMKAMLASGYIRPEIDPVSLRLLLTFGSINQPRTILRGVNMLLPAHRMIIEGGRERIERYWSIEENRLPELKSQPYEELVRQVGDLLEESVRLQMVSDVPIGAFLSGGVDSTFTVGLMTKIAGRRVKTFSVGFEAEGASLDESGEAERSANFLGADHTRVVIRGADLRDRLPHVVRGLDQPSVDGVNSYFVSMVARRAVTVAISGTGGDELFAGYPWFTAMALHEQQVQNDLQGKFTKIAGQLGGHPIVERLLPRRWGNYFYRARHNAGFLARYGNAYQIFGAYGATKIINPHLHRSADAGRTMADDLEPTDELSHSGAVERVSALCLRGYTNNQLLRDIDATSMAHSLEVRVPFLDVPLLDLALSLPASAKIGNVTQVENVYTATYRSTGTKKILVDAGRRMGILPEDIDLQPKRGFTFPMDAWLRGNMRDILDDTLSPQTTHSRGLLQPQEVEQVRQGFLEGQLHWTQPWLLMVLELWCREFL